MGTRTELRDHGHPISVKKMIICDHSLQMLARGFVTDNRPKHIVEVDLFETFKSIRDL